MTLDWADLLHSVAALAIGIALWYHRKKLIDSSIASGEAVDKVFGRSGPANTSVNRGIALVIILTIATGAMLNGLHGIARAIAILWR